MLARNVRGCKKCVPLNVERRLYSACLFVRFALRLGDCRGGYRSRISQNGEPAQRSGGYSRTPRHALGPLYPISVGPRYFAE
jgi:hypothetical protein